MIPFISIIQQRLLESLRICFRCFCLGKPGVREEIVFFSVQLPVHAEAYCIIDSLGVHPIREYMAASG